MKMEIEFEKVHDDFRKYDYQDYAKQINVLADNPSSEIVNLFKELMKKNKQNLDLIIDVTRELAPKYPFSQEVSFGIVRDNLIFKGSHNLKENAEREFKDRVLKENCFSKSNEKLDKLAPDILTDSILKVKARIGGKFEKVQDDFIKFNQEKIDYSLVDAFAYEDLGKCLTFGAKKYSKNNWIKGDLDTYTAALERHLNDIKKAVQTGDKSYFMDKDSSLQHGSNLLCNAMFIHYFIRKEIEKDVK